MKAIFLILSLLSTLSAVASPLFPYEPEQTSHNRLPAISKKIGFDQKLNAEIPGNLLFRDESGNAVTLSELIADRPTLLGMVYYGCPNLCTLTLNGLFKGMQEVPFSAGDKFSVIFVSIDPKETPQLAQEKKKTYLNIYRRAGSGKGIHFLTGGEAAIQSLASAIGFRYTYDPNSKQYAHPAGITVLTPQGRISKYLFGVEYLGRDLRLSLVEASQRKIGTPIDKFLLYCYHYDPVAGRYGFIILDALRIGGILTLLALGGTIFFLLQVEKRKTGAKAP